MTNPFFSRLGGKKRLKKTIISMMPEHDKYVEPFVGTGSVFLAKGDSKKSVINDKDKDVYKLWNTMKNKPSSFKSCKTPTTKQAFEKIKSKPNKNACDLLGLNKMSYLGNFKSYTNNDSVCPTQRKKCGMKSLEKNIPKYAEKLKTTRVMNQDFKRVFNVNDGKKTLTYMDPPYWKTNNSYGDLKDDVTPGEVCKLAKKAKGKVIISYNDHPEVRKACKGLNIKKVTTHYEIGKTSSSDGKGVAKELIITNFKKN